MCGVCEREGVGSGGLRSGEGVSGCQVVARGRKEERKKDARYTVRRVPDSQHEHKDVNPAFVLKRRSESRRHRQS